MDDSKKWKWTSPSTDEQTQSLLKKLGSNYEEYLRAIMLPNDDIDLPEYVYEASEKMEGKRLPVTSYADPLGYYNKVGEIKGKLLADSKYTGESSSRLAIIHESAKEQDSVEMNSDGPQEILADAHKEAQSAIKSANDGKPSNKRKRQ